jgi:hypothetical protein
MAGHELIGLQHSDPLTNRHQALIEGYFQNALGRLAAGPRVVFFHRLVFDVADGERAISADTRQHSAQLTTGNPAEPVDATLPIPAHVADKETQVLRRHIRQGVRPILKNGFVDGLCLVQMLAPIGGNARVEDVVMAALDDVDGVDLQVAQLRHRRRRCLRAGAERFGGVQALGMQPDSAGLE